MCVCAPFLLAFLLVCVPSSPRREAVCVAVAVVCVYRVVGEAAMSGKGKGCRGGGGVVPSSAGGDGGGGGPLTAAVGGGSLPSSAGAPATGVVAVGAPASGATPGLGTFAGQKRNFTAASTVGAAACSPGAARRSPSTILVRLVASTTNAPLAVGSEYEIGEGHPTGHDVVAAGIKQVFARRCAPAGRAAL